MASFNKSEIMNKVIREANKQGVPVDLALALANQESGFNPNAKSSAGAIGVMQLMPATARSLGVNPNNVDDNIKGGITYLKNSLAHYNGDVVLALASYNAGYGAVDKYKGVPPYRETQNYVKSIMNSIGRYTKVANNNNKIASNIQEVTSGSRPSVNVPTGAASGITEQDLMRMYSGYSQQAKANINRALRSDDEIRKQNIVNQYLSTDSLSYQDVINALKSLGASAEELAAIPQKNQYANVDAMLSRVSPASLDELQAQQNQATQNLIEGYQAMRNNQDNIYDRLDKAYNDYNAALRNDVRLQQGNYKVTPEQINNFQELQLQNQLAANAFGRPQLQLTSPQELARQQYEAEIANQYGIPYDTLKTAYADYVKNSALGQLQKAKDYLAAGGTLSQTDKEYIKQLAGVAAIDPNITKEIITQRGNVAKEALSNIGEAQKQALQNTGSATTTGMTTAGNIASANIYTGGNVAGSAADLTKARIAAQRDAAITEAQLNQRYNEMIQNEYLKNRELALDEQKLNAQIPLWQSQRFANVLGTGSYFPNTFDPAIAAQTIYPNAGQAMFTPPTAPSTNTGIFGFQPTRPQPYGGQQ